jgi:superfamily II DNA or RNA helicase
MSTKIKIKSLSMDIRQKIIKDLKIEKKLGKYEKVQKFLEPYYIDEKSDEIYLPFAWCLENIKNIKRPEREELDKINVKFTGKLRENQKIVKDEAITLLNKTGSAILSLYCGFGKTFLSILLATKIGLKTLIICHRIVLIEQWKESILKVCPDAKFQILDTKIEIDKNADFYIANAQNIEKFGFEPFKKIGTVIVDECHVIATDTLSKSLFYSTPRYIIGLSATPHRSDGMDVLLDLYFGKNKILRKLYRKHNVYRVNTGLEFETKQTRDGKLDWNSIIEAQSNNEERNEMIIQVILKHKDRHFLVLCKRISQAEYLIQKLKEHE